MKNLVTIITIALISICNILAAQTVVPNTNVKDLDGNSVAFKSQLDSTKYTIVSFWATWCGPCIQELNAIDGKYAAWQTKYKVNLIAVSIDDARNSKKVKPKVLGYGWSYKVLIDENQDLARELNVSAPPVTFIVNPKGEIVYTHIGYSPGSEDELEVKLAELTSNNK